MNYYDRMILMCMVGCWLFRAVTLGAIGFVLYLFWFWITT